MGCFLACFGKAHGKRRKPKGKTLTRDRSRRNYESLPPSSPLKEDVPESAVVSVTESRCMPAVVSVPESRDKPAVVSAPELRDKPVVFSVPELRDKHENLSFNNRKKVTFDLNVKTYAEVSIHEAPNNSLEIESEEKEREKEDKKAEKGTSLISLSEDNSTGSYPSCHRYQNFIASDDEVGDDDEEEEYEDSDFDDSDDDREEEEESFESYFSLRMDKEQEISSSPTVTKEVIDSTSVCGSVDQKPKILANGARDRSQYVHSVLNPVENLSQWKAVKAKPIPVKHQKENIDLEQQLHIPFSAEPTLKAPKPQLSSDQCSNFNVPKHPPKQEVSVDTSLSNWLVTPTSKTSIAGSESSEQSTSRKTYSSINREDRPILGALTVEELKSSVTSSPRRSPSQSPDDIPILGTVGSYWSHKTQSTCSDSPCRSTGSDSKGIPNTTSKYREDKRVNWHSTPFEVRLERALNRGAAEDCSSYPPRVC